jgi:methylated-DNA-[protein]-cysteine S-methyltransferase
LANPISLFTDTLETPIGRLILAADAEGRLRLVDWTDHEDRYLGFLARRFRKGAFRLESARNPGGLTSAIAAYFEGDLAAIDNLPVEGDGTAFQRHVWDELRRIPCGSTLSYGEMARHIGKPAAVRAVGLANGANPIGVVVPCHRVIGSDGSLTGYGGGIERKRWLLAHEGALKDEAGKLFEERCESNKQVQATIK